MRILTFAASNSSMSINQQLAEYAASLIEGHTIETLDIHDYEMPIYRHDREVEGGVPQLAHDFLARIAAADALIVSFAEHNGNYSAAFKNLFDWCSRTTKEVWQHKRMLLLSTSPGGRGGANVMSLAEAAVPRFGGEVVGTFSVPQFYQNFAQGKLTDEALDAELRALVAKLTA